MNPKVKMIVDECFPKIIETHIRTRSPQETTKKSLESYREMGLRAIRNLPAEEQERDHAALEGAYFAAVARLEEFHDRETARSDLARDQAPQSN